MGVLWWLTITYAMAAMAQMPEAGVHRVPEVQQGLNGRSHVQ